MADDSEDDVRAGSFEVDDLEFVVVSEPLPDLSELDQLTHAERAVVKLVFDGLSNAEIAAERDVSERTVANQLASVYRKLDVGSRAELVTFVLEMADS
jgi:DNA-binding NarL/FixJ family response regulator